MSKELFDAARLQLSDVPAGARDYAKGEGCALIQLFDRSGREVTRREARNLVVQDGMAYMANRTFSSTPKVMNFMQLGKNGAAATTAQDDVLTPIAAATLADRQTVGTAAMSGTRTAKFEHTWTAGEFSAAGLEEAGLFNEKTTAGTAGSDWTMLARFVYTLVNKTSSDTLKITWTVKVS